MLVPFTVAAFRDTPGVTDGKVDEEGDEEEERGDLGVTVEELAVCSVMLALLAHHLPPPFASVLCMSHRRTREVVKRTKAGSEIGPPEKHQNGPFEPLQTHSHHHHPPSASEKTIEETRRRDPAESSDPPTLRTDRPHRAFVCCLMASPDLLMVIPLTTRAWRLCPPRALNAMEGVRAEMLICY
ncbi:unnamed protein product [Lampetra fluviatilis]